MSITKFLLPRVLKLIYDKYCEKRKEVEGSNTSSDVSFSLYCELIYDRFKGFNYKEAYINNFPATGLSLLCLYNLLKENKIIIANVIHESYSVVKIYTLSKKEADVIKRYRSLKDEDLLIFYCNQLNIRTARDLKSLMKEIGYSGLNTINNLLNILGALYNCIPKDKVLNYLKEVL